MNDMEAHDSPERRELAPLFISMSAERVQEIVDAVRDERYEQASIAAHTLKSMARHMGFDELGDACARIEAEVHQLLPDSAHPLVTQTVRLHARAEEVVRGWIG